MAINWFPGHMHKARKEIKKTMPQVDLVIEVLDARIPSSSENPLVPRLRGDTPFLKVLSKSDLADPDVTSRWLQELERERGVRAFAWVQRQAPAPLFKLIRQLAKPRSATGQLRAMILGVPNVGKSTLINSLAGRAVAKTGNEPAVTRAQQRIALPDDILLLDTPGFLWPKLSPEACGYRLAATGAIKDALFDSEEVALFLAEFLLAAYPRCLKDRYRLDSLPQAPLDLLEAIGARRGCARKGGGVDLAKASDLLLNEFRSGVLGRISLETPESAKAEAAKVQAEKAKAHARDDEEEEGESCDGAD